MHEIETLMYYQQGSMNEKGKFSVTHLTLISACALLVGCQPAADPQVLGTIERDRLELVAEAHEPIAELLVHEGDHVSSGQVLLRQSAGAMQPRIEQAQAQVDKAQQQLRELQRGARIQEKVQARAAVESATSALKNAELEFQRAEQLVQAKLQSQSLLDQARATRDALAASLKQAQAGLQLLNEGTRAEQIAQAQAVVQAAQAALTELKISADRYELTAPRAGVIEALPYKQGERPPIAQTLVVMLAGNVYARVYVPEVLRSRYHSGAQVQVHADGVEQALTGQVRYISAQAAFTPYYSLTQQDRGRLSYLAEISLPNTAEMPAGLPVQVVLSAIDP
ncbi:MAG: HlyD family secretion protein [Steroidobacteraceae bacterium]